MFVLSHGWADAATAVGGKMVNWWKEGGYAEQRVSCS